MSEPCMRITNVEIERIEQSLWGAFWEIQRTAPCASPMSLYPAYAGSLESWSWPQAVVLVRIEVESGHSGIGWAEDGVGAASSIIREHLRRLLIGADAQALESLWDQMYRASIPYGRKGAALEAISAVDLALWDLRGKIAGAPVYRLLGGPVRSKLRAYASHLHPVDMDRFVEEAVAYVREGYRALKMRMPGHPAQGSKGIQLNVERVRVLREALGDDVDLMVDAYMGWDLPFALQMARKLEPYRVAWMEEPLLPDQVDEFAELRGKSPIPIATGEHEFTTFGFKLLIDRRAADILQPDVHRAGGLTGTQAICTLARAAELPVVPHILSAATVHLAAAQENCPMVEHLTRPVWASQIPDSEPALLGQPEVICGEVGLNDCPGLGVSINPARAPHLEHWNADQDKPRCAVLIDNEPRKGHTG